MSSIDKWYIKVTDTDRIDTKRVEIHWFYKFLIWLEIKKQPVINPLDLFSIKRNERRNGMA